MSSRSVFLAAALASGFGSSASAQQVRAFTPVPGVKELSGQLLVRPIQEKDWAIKGINNGPQLSAQARQLIAANTLRVLPLTDIHVVKLAQGEAEQDVAAQLMQTGLFEFAEPDWIVYPLSEPETRPDDPSVIGQWHIDKIRAPKAWNGFTGDGSIICAFVDTGVDVNHPDIAPLLVPGFNSVTNIPQVSGGQVFDVNGHGTAVAGAALAMGNNNAGGTGVCWTGRIMPVRASNFTTGSAFLSNVLYGANWAAFNGAKVVSVSYAGVESASVEPTGAVIKNSYGGLLVWAAGNTSTYLNFDYPATTIVGSTDRNDVLAWDTSYGPAIDVMAPGVQLLVPAIGGGYALRDGTSFAAPVAAGVLALAWSSSPSLTPDQAMGVLYRSAEALEPVHPMNSTGWGRVDALRSIELARGIAPPKTAQLLAAANVPPVLTPGLEIRYFDLPFVDRLPSRLGGSPMAVATISNVNFGGGGPAFPGCPLASGFGASISGFIEVPSTGVYTFTLWSRDGSRLMIDGHQVVDNDGIHPSRFRSGSIWLERGMHRLSCDYFSSTAQPHLVLSIRGQHLGEAVIPPSMLRREPNRPLPTLLPPG